MRHYPAFLDIKERPCLVVGGGAAALAKTRLLRNAGALVTVVAPAFDANLHALGETTTVRLVARPFCKADIADCVLVHAASGVAHIDEAVASAALEKNIPVNVVDRASLSSFIMPAIVDRGTVVIGISSGGASPVLARRVKNELEALLPQGLGRLADFAKCFRSAVQATFSDLETRLRFWEAFFDGPLADAVMEGRQDNARKRMLAQVNGAHFPVTGVTHEIEIDPAEPDLLTLRDIRRIARADIVEHHPTIGPEVLNHARRDAHFVQSTVGMSLSGKRVVRLIPHTQTRLAAS